jgi:nicotinate-nucleotide adenylyltransferase
VERRRLGLFGGTFDPPHLGHVAALEAARRTGEFDRILVTVAGEPWQKTGARSLSQAARRLAMAHAAFDHLEGVEVTDREIRRPGPTYTVDTVEELIAEGWTVTLLIGEDSAAGLDGWHEPDRLAAHVDVCIVPREGEHVTLSSRWRCTRIEMSPVDLSSTWVRERVAAGEDCARFVPAGVVALLATEPG